MGWVEAELGRQMVDPPAFDLHLAFEDSASNVPLIFILSSGADPASLVLAFAQAQDVPKHVDSVSLGQGQGPKARRMIEEGCTEGNWVLICNCHLGLSWLPELERLLEALDPKAVNGQFRLWLTSAPSSQFPVSVLQNGVKINNEPPKGLRANLLQTYTGMEDAMLEDCKMPEAYRRLLFGACFFHAIVVERRRFGPIGWNSPYRFMPEDLAVFRRQLKALLDDSVEVPY
jgi:dynein heavy chain